MADQSAGIDRSFEFIDCKVGPGELQFILESEAKALEFMPTNRKNWGRRGRMIVFCFDAELEDEQAERWGYWKRNIFIGFGLALTLNMMSY